MTFQNGRKNKMLHFAAWEPETVKLHGPLGSMLDRVVKNRLVKIDYGQLAAPFRLRNETDNKWCCEFRGKVVQSDRSDNREKRHSLQINFSSFFQKSA